MRAKHTTNIDYPSLPSSVEDFEALVTALFVIKEELLSPKLVGTEQERAVPAMLSALHSLLSLQPLDVFKAAAIVFYGGNSPAFVKFFVEVFGLFPEEVPDLVGEHHIRKINNRGLGTLELLTISVHEALRRYNLPDACCEIGEHVSWWCKSEEMMEKNPDLELPKPLHFPTFDTLSNAARRFSQRHPAIMDGWDMADVCEYWSVPLAWKAFVPADMVWEDEELKTVEWEYDTGREIFLRLPAVEHDLEQLKQALCAS